MPLSEDDVYRKEIDDAIADVKQQIVTANAHGVSPRLPDYDELFGKILKSAERDPRIRPRAVDELKDHAKKNYQELATKAGFRGNFNMDTHVLRGLQVHVAVMVTQGATYVETYADERHAANAVDQFLEKQSVKVSAAQISLWQTKAGEGVTSASEHPLYGTSCMGTRVETCTIN